MVAAAVQLAAPGAGALAPGLQSGEPAAPAAAAGAKHEEAPPQDAAPAALNGERAPAQGPQHGHHAAQDAAGAVRYFNWDQRSTARAAMQTLVAALADDPVNTYFCGTRRRRRFVKDEVKGYLKALRRATHFIVTPNSQAVALWQLLPAETPRNELWAGWTRILAVAPRLWAQLLRLELRYEAAHEAACAAHGPFYYLSFIGTAPEARGRGLGGALLAEVTRRADEEGRWCLLEATSPRSEALYARHGFVTYETYRVSRKAPPVFLMRRAPAAPSSPPPAPAACEAPAAPAADAGSANGAPTAPDLAAAVAAKVAQQGAGSGQQEQPVPPAPARKALPQALSSHALISLGGGGLLEEEDSAPGGGGGSGFRLASDDGGASSCCLSDDEGGAPAAAADARVIIRSGSNTCGAGLKQGPSQHQQQQQQQPGQEPAAGSQEPRSGAASRVQHGEQQDEAGCDSSSPAGAGGPSAAAGAAL